MPDSIVSVRMPAQLLDQLRETAERQHYMDLSEAVRNMVRQKASECLKNENTTDQIIQGLQTLISQLQNAGTQEN